MSHGDHVEKLPNGFEILASSDHLPIAAFGNTTKKMYGLQFHPESFASTIGTEILNSFTKICLDFGR